VKNTPQREDLVPPFVITSSFPSRIGEPSPSSRTPPCKTSSKDGYWYGFAQADFPPSIPEDTAHERKRSPTERFWRETTREALRGSILNAGLLGFPEIIKPFLEEEASCPDVSLVKQ